jgi:hypothetical protein
LKQREICVVHKSLFVFKFFFSFGSEKKSQKSEGSLDIYGKVLWIQVDPPTLEQSCNRWLEKRAIADRK